MTNESKEETLAFFIITGVLAIILPLFLIAISILDYNSEDLKLCNDESVGWREWFNGNYRFAPERVNDHLNCCEFVVNKMDDVWRRDRVCKAVEDLK